MIICRIAYDAEGKDEERKALFEAHRAHLRSGMIPILQSGPLFSPAGPKRGALIVFQVEDIGEVERFNSLDPYIINGIYDDVEILRWDKTIG